MHIIHVLGMPLACFFLPVVSALTASFRRATRTRSAFSRHTTKTINCGITRELQTTDAGLTWLTLEHFARSSDISWIGSLQLAMVLACAILAGKAFDAGYIKYLLSAAVLFYTAGWV